VPSSDRGVRAAQLNLWIAGNLSAKWLNTPPLLVSHTRPLWNRRDCDFTRWSGIASGSSRGSDRLAIFGVRSGGGRWRPRPRSKPRGTEYGNREWTWRMVSKALRLRVAALRCHLTPRWSGRVEEKCET